MQNYENTGVYIALISCASNVVMARYAKKETDQAEISGDIALRISRIEDNVSDIHKLLHETQKIMLKQNDEINAIHDSLHIASIRTNTKDSPRGS